MRRRTHESIFALAVEFAVRWRRFFPRLRGHNLIYYLLRQAEPRGYVPGVVRRNGRDWHIHGLRNNCESAIYYGRIPETDIQTHHILRQTVAPGDVVVDIGANVGYYTALLSELVGECGRVHAFEASPLHFEVLRENMQLQGCCNVLVTQVALTDMRREVVHFTTHNSGSIVSPFTEYGQECVAETRLITASLDELLPAEDTGRVRLIKIDVDGNEIGVIEGARRVIAAARPLLLLEVCDRTQRAAGASALELLRKVEDLGYCFVLDPEEKPVGAREILPRVEERFVFADVLCLPARI